MVMGVKNIVTICSRGTERGERSVGRTKREAAGASRVELAGDGRRFSSGEQQDWALGLAGTDSQRMGSTILV
jgi:hypothetical protein